MTDRDIKTIELIINNEQARKKLEELKVRRLGLSQGVWYNYAIHFLCFLRCGVGYNIQHYKIADVESEEIAGMFEKLTEKERG